MRRRRSASRFRESKYTIGNTRIKISCPRCTVTQTEVDRILREIADTAQRSLIEAAMEDEYGQEDDQEIAT